MKPRGNKPLGVAWHIAGVITMLALTVIFAIMAGWPQQISQLLHASSLPVDPGLRFICATCAIGSFGAVCAIIYFAYEPLQKRLRKR
jgi:hypothetical protein